MIHYSVSLYSVKINSATGRQLFLDRCEESGRWSSEVWKLRWKGSHRGRTGTGDHQRHGFRRCKHHHGRWNELYWHKHTGKGKDHHWKRNTHPYLNGCEPEYRSAAAGRNCFPSSYLLAASKKEISERLEVFTWFCRFFGTLQQMPSAIYSHMV